MTQQAAINFSLASGMLLTFSALAAAVVGAAGSTLLDDPASAPRSCDARLGAGSRPGAGARRPRHDARRCRARRRSRVSASSRRPSKRRVAGIATTVVRPSGGPPWPALVFMNGATPDGRRHPTRAPTQPRAGASRRRASSSPTLPASPEESCRRRTLAQSVAVSEAAASSPETAEERVALVGVSVGGTLALLAAADAQLRQRDLGRRLRRAVRRSRRGDAPRDDRHLPGRRTRRHHAPPPYLRVGLARSLAAMLADHRGDCRALPRAARARPRVEQLRSSSRSTPSAGGHRGRATLRPAREHRPARFDSLLRRVARARPRGRRRAVAHPRRATASGAGGDRNRAAGHATSPSPKRRHLSQPHRMCGSPSRHCSRTQHHASDLRNVAELHRLYAFFTRSFRAATNSASATLDGGADVKRIRVALSPGRDGRSHASVNAAAAADRRFGMAKRIEQSRKHGHYDPRWTADARR